MAELGRTPTGRVRLPRAPRRRAPDTAALTDRRRRVASVAGRGAAAALVALAGSATWYYAERITEAPHRRPRPLAPDEDVEVVDLVTSPADGHRIVLRGPAAARPGWWWLDLSEGSLRVGPPEHTSADDGPVAAEHLEAVRPVELVSGTVQPGDRGRLDADAAPEDPARLGLAVEEVTVQGPLGGMPAWWFPADPAPAEATTACVIAHGRSGSRREGLRWVPTLVAAGVPTLVVSYRNDPDAPPSPDGRCHLGATEWEDVAAGLRFALDHQGTTTVEDAVLFGISMGGACIAELLARSDLAPRVRALVLDAPVRHWGPVLRAAAAERGVPSAVVPMLLPPTMALAGARGRIDWRGLDHLDDPARFDLPTLLFHGDADLTVPAALSDAFAQRRRDVVTYVRVPGAGHVQSWNTDRDRCEAALHDFLASVLDDEGHPEP